MITGATSANSSTSPIKRKLVAEDKDIKDEGIESCSSVKVEKKIKREDNIEEELKVDEVEEND